MFVWMVKGVGGFALDHNFASLYSPSNGSGAFEKKLPFSISLRTLLYIFAFFCVSDLALSLDSRD